jgi:hypothetical protein
MQMQWNISFVVEILLLFNYSWNPAGAIRAGRNPAAYKLLGETVNVNGLFSYLFSWTYVNCPFNTSFIVQHFHVFSGQF